jgi:cysteine desulfurase family protein (TIGR01976 family)
LSKNFDARLLREKFPSLNQQVHGDPVIFFDGPGGTQTPSSVIEAIGNYLRKDNSNLGGAFPTSRNTVSLTLNARQAMADFFNASRPEEIVFGQNMTSLTMAMSRAISMTWKAGDEIIVTNLDHDANITPWTLAAADRHVVVNRLDFRPDDCTLMLEDLPALINERTRLVAVTLASNATGSLVDVAQVCKLAHAVGALVYVDAVHCAPHANIDVQAIDCDFLAASAYKFFGPHLGIMYGRYDLLDSMDAYKVRPAPNDPPGKWETGTQSFEALAAVLAAMEYLEGIGRQFGNLVAKDGDVPSNRRDRLEQAMMVISQYEQSLSLRFLQKATSVPGLRVFGITDVERLGERTPTFAVSLDSYTPREVAKYLGKRGIFVWDGHYYAVAVLERLGLLERGGLVRIGFVHYNTPEEVDRLIEALYTLAAN